MVFDWRRSGVMKPKNISHISSQNMLFFVNTNCKGSCLMNQCKYRKSNVSFVIYCHGAAEYDSL